MWVTSSYPLPPPSCSYPFCPSAGACTREAQVSPVPSSFLALQFGSLPDQRQDMLGKGESYLSGRGRTTAHPQCNRLQLRACFALL